MPAPLSVCPYGGHDRASCSRHRHRPSAPGDGGVPRRAPLRHADPRIGYADPPVPRRRAFGICRRKCRPAGRVGKGRHSRPAFEERECRPGSDLSTRRHAPCPQIQAGQQWTRSGHDGGGTAQGGGRGGFPARPHPPSLSPAVTQALSRGDSRGAGGAATMTDGWRCTPAAAARGEAGVWPRGTSSSRAGAEGTVSRDRLLGVYFPVPDRAAGWVLYWRPTKAARTGPDRWPNTMSKS